MKIKNKENESNSRRKLLKTAAASSGIAVAATALPANWTKPVIDSILLPAHAQTSGAVVGGVYTSAPVGVSFSPKKMKSGVQFALLDTLISPANAQVVLNGSKPNSHIVKGICRGVNDDDDTFDPATITFRVNANDTVDVAVSSSEIVGDDGDDGLPCSAATTIISGTTIQDVTVQLDDDEFLALTNIVASATEITGDWATEYIDDDDDFSSCGGTFTAPIGGGSFPSTQDCSLIN